MTAQTKRNSLFWLGFIVALVVVVGLSAYYYNDNKDKKLKDIKKLIEDFMSNKFKSLSCHKKTTKADTKKKIKKLPKKPKKFIVKK